MPHKILIATKIHFMDFEVQIIKKSYLFAKLPDTVWDDLKFKCEELHCSLSKVILVGPFLIGS